MPPTPVRIAVVLPLTGAEALFGQQGLQGARMAAAEINAEGGVLHGRPISLEVHDEGTDLDRAVTLTRAAVDSGVSAVLGPTSSAHRDAMLPICAAARVPCSMPPTTKAAPAPATCSATPPYPTTTYPPWWRRWPR